MNCTEAVLADIKEIISHRYDNGADLWSTPDCKLLKGAPFTTLESALYLLELGVFSDDLILKNTAELIFRTWREDGRFKTSPTGGSYPCHTALAVKVLCSMGYADDDRIQKSFQYFFKTQQPDGGWKCNKYSFGRGPETEYSTPYTTLVILDALRFANFMNYELILDKAVDFLLEHWTIKKPISPCHYGIGSRFMRVEYPFRGYNLFYYVYVLSFYQRAQKDERFLDAFRSLASQTVNDQIVVERVVPKLSKLSFCRKGQPSTFATKRYHEILQNLQQPIRK